MADELRLTAARSEWRSRLLGYLANAFSPEQLHQFFCSRAHGRYSDLVRHVPNSKYETESGYMLAVVRELERECLDDARLLDDLLNVKPGSLDALTDLVALRARVKPLVLVLASSDEGQHELYRLPTGHAFLGRDVLVSSARWGRPAIRRMMACATITIVEAGANSQQDAGMVSLLEEIAREVRQPDRACRFAFVEVRGNRFEDAWGAPCPGHKLRLDRGYAVEDLDSLLPPGPTHGSNADPLGFFESTLPQYAADQKLTAKEITAHVKDPDLQCNPWPDRGVTKLVHLGHRLIWCLGKQPQTVFRVIEYLDGGPKAGPLSTKAAWMLMELTTRNKLPKSAYGAALAYVRTKIEHYEGLCSQVSMDSEDLGGDSQELADLKHKMDLWCDVERSIESATAAGSATTAAAAPRPTRKKSRIKKP